MSAVLCKTGGQPERCGHYVIFPAATSSSYLTITAGMGEFINVPIEETALFLSWCVFIN
jgi:hypothetical protein